MIRVLSLGFREFRVKGLGLSFSGLGGVGFLSGLGSWSLGVQDPELRIQELGLRVQDLPGDPIDNNSNQPNPSPPETQSAKISR